MDIYGTIGPACLDDKLLEEMFLLGMTGMRLNLSHTELSDCHEWTDKIKQAAKSAGVKPKILIDLQGPELRIGKLETPILLREGEQIILESQNREETKSKELDCGLFGCQEYGQSAAAISVPEPVIARMETGQQVLLDDGKIMLVVLASEQGRSCCQVSRGGILASKKSIALQGIELYLPTLTESDRKNLRQAREHGVTGVMLPFVSKAYQLQNLKRELLEMKEPELEIFAKIENLEGFHNLKHLLPYADHIVIARGDLGNRMPLWELPPIQAEIAKVCRKEKKPFMVVTQMLASMEEHKVPTRAEVSDIFRAVSEGAFSVMVTGETAAGRYPVEAMKYLCRTVQSAQEYLKERQNRERKQI